MPEGGTPSWVPRVRGAGAPGGPQLPEMGRAGPLSCLAALGSLLSTCAAVAMASVPSVAQALLPLEERLDSHSFVQSPFLEHRL